MTSLDDELERHLRPRRRMTPARWVLAVCVGLVVAYVAYVGAALAYWAITSEDERDDECIARYAHDGGDAGRLRDALARVEATGAGARLADLTPFADDWDQVYAISAGLVVAAPGEEGHGVVDTSALVGCKAMLPYRASFPIGSVLYFMRDGKLVRALEVGYFVADEQPPWGRSGEVRIESGKPDPRCAVRCLRLVEPGQS
ncbi:hypothetical protein [Yinghuangia soli]|uniref:Uncharacterized protein n=1 Tax=Yinghuangia soli TaxID=2908204 RepID=A0AA41Q7N3_9ACTN|nr:hypothetical protein [Yinghuangia soli]MCF2533018.1 hypothetical protein [Yinghuangia soli]